MWDGGILFIRFAEISFGLFRLVFCCPVWATVSSAWQTVLVCGLLLSLGIECLQWIFGSGVSDIDDIIFNGMGALLGYWIGVVCRKKR